MNNKTVYQTNDAGYYTHDEQAAAFALAEDEYNVPFGAVVVAPPALDAGYRARWSSRLARHERLYASKGKWLVEPIPVDLHAIGEDGRYRETIITDVPTVGPNLEHLPTGHVLIAPPAVEEGCIAVWSSRFAPGTPEFATLGQWREESLAPLPELPAPGPDPAMAPAEPAGQAPDTVNPAST